jgi:UDP-glucose 4-epimerase
VRGEYSPPKIEYIPYETFGKYEDVQRRIPDITRAQQILGFQPNVDLESGLQKTIQWQIKRRNENR